MAPSSSDSNDSIFKIILITTFLLKIIGCSHVSVLQTGKVKIDNEQYFFTYNKSIEVQKSDRILCAVTGIIYGGWCWYYLGMPNSKQLSQLEVDLGKKIISRYDKNFEILEINTVKRGYDITDEHFLIRKINSNEMAEKKCSDFTVNQNEESTYAPIEHKYKSYKELVDEVEAKAKNEMLSEKEKKDLMATIPIGGYFVITIRGATIDAANTKYFTYIVKMNGKEIDRIHGDNDIPEVPPTNSSAWWNIDSIRINKKINHGDTVEIFIINKLRNTRESFIITKSKNETCSP